jgi:hypothetical protein
MPDEYDDLIEEKLDMTPFPSRAHVAQLERKLTDALLLAEMWLRSPHPETRMMGADLKQVLDGS